MSVDETGVRAEPPPRGALVTLAALYGAGGSVVGPRVAERLGVEFLDREIPKDVARRTGLSEEAVGDVDERPRSRMARLTETLARASNLTGDAAGSDERPDLQERRLRGYIEEFLARSSASGGVALGRGGMVVLRRRPVGAARLSGRAARGAHPAGGWRSKASTARPPSNARRPRTGPDRLRPPRLRRRRRGPEPVPPDDRLDGARPRHVRRPDRRGQPGRTRQTSATRPDRTPA